MIKDSTYIRRFSKAQRLQLEKLQKLQPKLKTVPDLLFFALENYLDQLPDIERLQRLIVYKQNKIDNLTQSKNASI